MSSSRSSTSSSSHSPHNCRLPDLFLSLSAVHRFPVGQQWCPSCGPSSCPSLIYIVFAFPSYLRRDLCARQRLLSFPFASSSASTRSTSLLIIILLDPNHHYQTLETCPTNRIVIKFPDRATFFLTADSVVRREVEKKQKERSRELGGLQQQQQRGVHIVKVPSAALIYKNEDIAAAAKTKNSKAERSSCSVANVSLRMSNDRDHRGSPVLNEPPQSDRNRGSLLLQSSVLFILFYMPSPLLLL